MNNLLEYKLGCGLIHQGIQGEIVSKKNKKK